MKITWYYDDFGSHIEKFTTDGELPLVGSKIFCNDYTDGIPKRQTFFVKSSAHVITTCRINQNGITFPTHPMSLEARLSFVENFIKTELNGTFQCSITDKVSGENFIIYATQTGEVILLKEE